MGDCGLRGQRAGICGYGIAGPPIIERLSPDERWGSLAFGLSVLTLVILVRIAWLVVYRTGVGPSGAGVLVHRAPEAPFLVLGARDFVGGVHHWVLGS